MQTIRKIKQRNEVRKMFGYAPRDLTVRDAAYTFAAQLGREIETKMNELADKKDSYFILVKAHKTDVSTVENKCLILSEKPEKMLGTMLFFVDNRKGQFKKEWVLPFDYPVDPSLLSEEDCAESVLEDIKDSGIPLI